MCLLNCAKEERVTSSVETSVLWKSVLLVALWQ